MFVRGGAIIPTAPEMKFVGEKPADPITFDIYPDEKGSASTTLYEDDGISPAYRQGVFRRTTVNVSRGAQGYLAEVGNPTGSYNPGVRKLIFSIKSSTISGSATIADDGGSHKIAIK